MNSEAKLQRRVLLKALGLGLSAPLAFQFSKMAVAQTTRPKRLILFYFPHGVPNEHMDMEPYLMPGNAMFQNFGSDPASGSWNPIKEAHVAQDYTFNTRTGYNMLSPLEPYRDQLSIVRGLYQSGQFGTHDSIASILTGDGASPSLDQRVAQELGMKSLFLGVVTRVNAQLDLTNGVLSRNESGWRNPENDVVKLYDELFGNIAAPQPNEPATDDTTFRNQAIDLTIGEITELRKAVSGLTQEENKLSAHLAGLENIKAQAEGLGGATGDACLAAPPVPHLDEFRAAKATYMANDGTEYWQEGSLIWKTPSEDQQSNFIKLVEAQAELAGFAALCGHAQVITIQNAWASADYPLPTLLPATRTDKSYHTGVSHQPYTGNVSNDLRLDYGRVQEYFLARVARICEILNQPDPFDPSHTALENSIVYAFSEIGDGNLHTKSLARQWIDQSMGEDIFSYYPAIIAGGGGGMMAPGRLITVDNRPIADLLLTLSKAMGSTATSFTSLSSGPIQELLA